MDSLGENNMAKIIADFVTSLLRRLFPDEAWNVDFRCLALAVAENDCPVYVIYICEYFLQFGQVPEGSECRLPSKGLHLKRRQYWARQHDFDLWTVERGINYLSETGDARSMLFYPSVQAVEQCNLHLYDERIREMFDGEKGLNASLMLQAQDGHYILVIFRLQHKRFLHALVWDVRADVEACTTAIKRMQDQLCLYLPETAFSFRGKLERMNVSRFTGEWLLEVLRRWSDSGMRWYRDQEVCPEPEYGRQAWLEKLGWQAPRYTVC